MMVMDLARFLSSKRFTCPCAMDVLNMYQAVYVVVNTPKKDQIRKLWMVGRRMTTREIAPKTIVHVLLL
jgi:hypothetical protein